MKILTLSKLLSRIFALPTAWGVLVTPINAGMPEQNKAVTAGVPSSVPADRMKVLHSLLGEDIVPTELLGHTQTDLITPAHPSVIAQQSPRPTSRDRIQVPPSPPPPPPPPPPGPR